jgi:hypothetical protein
MKFGEIRCSAAARSLACSSEPPESRMRSPPSSGCARGGNSSRRRSSVGTRNVVLILYRAAASTSSSGLYGGGNSTLVPPIIRKLSVKPRPPPKYIGVATMFRSCSLKPMLTHCESERSVICRCVSIGPFGRPVVPEDSDISSGASGSIASGRGVPPMSRSAIVTQAVPAIGSASGSSTANDAPKCAATRRRSSPVQRTSSAISTPPARMIASIVATCASVSPRPIATTSCSATPRRCSPCARLSTQRSSSQYASVVAFWISAGWSGLRLALWRSASEKLKNIVR